MLDDNPEHWLTRAIRNDRLKHNFDKLGGVKLQLVYPTIQTAKELTEFDVDMGGYLEAHLANFGHYQFGSSITAPVYRLRDATSACEPISTNEIQLAQAALENYNGFILADAGGCSYETKARTIEQLGAQGAIIIELPDRGTNAGNDNIYDPNTSSIFFDVIYDGTGGSIRIPTLVLSFEHGEQLINLINNIQSQVVLKADLEMSHEYKEVVEYELFYGSVLDLSSEFILSLYKFQHALKGNAKFIPRIKTFDCEFCPDEVIESRCIDDGRYCFFLPEVNSLEKYPHIEPYRMLHENLRQRCLYEIAEEYDDQDRHIFLNYLYDVRVYCLEAEGQITHSCSKSVMNQLDINRQSVFECIAYERKGIDNTTEMKELFEEDRVQMLDYGVTLTPAVVINGQPFRGSLDGDTIFR